MARRPMLFDTPALSGGGAAPSRLRTYETSAGKRETVELAQRRQRYGPLPSGKLYLARIDIALTPDGQPDIRRFGQLASLSFKVTIAAGQSADKRWFWDRWVTESNSLPHEVRRKTEQVRDMMACYPKPETGHHTAGSLSGRVYPIFIEHDQHYRTGKTIARLGTLSPDPEHYLSNDFHDLVKRHGDLVPGIDLYPGSPSHKLMERRRRDRVAGEDGLSALERRRALNCERAVERMAAR